MPPAFPRSGRARGEGWRRATPTRRLGPGPAACGQRLRAGLQLPEPERGEQGPGGRPAREARVPPGVRPGAPAGSDLGSRSQTSGRASLAKGSGRAGSPTRASGDHRGGRLAGLGTEILTKECRPESQERVPTPARAPAGHRLHTRASLSERFPRAERWALGLQSGASGTKPSRRPPRGPGGRAALLRRPRGAGTGSAESRAARHTHTHTIFSKGEGFSALGVQQMLKDIVGEYIKMDKMKTRNGSAREPAGWGWARTFRGGGCGFQGRGGGRGRALARAFPGLDPAPATQNLAARLVAACELQTVSSPLPRVEAAAG